ncbi:MAG: methyltransferase domain-containing protein [Bacilli bacterium]|nr:methyltransferase domain-containing protein [Bacilli bacterium]
MNLYERNQKQRNFFNEKIDTYDDVHSTYMGTKNVLADNLDKNTKRILDLGAGTGLELIHLFELFPNVQVTVIDITENMLEKLKQRSFSSQVTTICADFFKTDFGKNYDAVISTSALHHFKPEEKQKLYQKIYKCLKDNGQFINCDYIALTQEIQDKQLYELDHNIDNYRHIDTPLTVNNEIKILKRVGFKDIKSYNVDIKDYKLIKARKK